MSCDGPPRSASISGLACRARQPSPWLVASRATSAGPPKPPMPDINTGRPPCSARSSTASQRARWSARVPSASAGMRRSKRWLSSRERASMRPSRKASRVSDGRTRPSPLTTAPICCSEPPSPVTCITTPAPRPAAAKQSDITAMSLAAWPSRPASVRAACAVTGSAAVTVISSSASRSRPDTPSNSAARSRRQAARCSLSAGENTPTGPASSSASRCSRACSRWRSACSSGALECNPRTIASRAASV